MIILSLFGTTVGLKVLNLPLAHIPPTVKLEDAWIEISGSQMTLRPDQDGFVVLRKIVGPHIATWIGLYRPAREIGYGRSGGFYGAGAWLIDSVADPSLVNHVIRNLADQIRSVSMEGDQFIKCILEKRAAFVQPPQTAEMISSIGRAPSAGFNPAGGTAFVFGGLRPTEVLEWAQLAPSASAFSKVFVGSAEHAPAGGVAASTQLFNSLPVAIEAVYKRASSELSVTRKELEQAKLNIRKLQDDSTSLINQNREQEDRNQKLVEEKKSLEKKVIQLSSLNHSLMSINKESSGNGTDGIKYFLFAVFTFIFVFVLGAFIVMYLKPQTTSISNFPPPETSNPVPHSPTYDSNAPKVDPDPYNNPPPTAQPEPQKLPKAAIVPSSPGPQPAPRKKQQAEK